MVIEGKDIPPPSSMVPLPKGLGGFGGNNCYGKKTQFKTHNPCEKPQEEYDKGRKTPLV